MPYRYPGVFNSIEGIVRSGLVAHYRFEQRSGQTLWDYSGFKNHGTLGSTAGADTNDLTWTAQGLSFGGDDYCTYPDPLLGATQCTIIAIVKRVTYLNFASIISDYGALGDKNFILGYESPQNSLSFFVGDGTNSAFVLSSGFSNNIFNIVVARYNATSQKAKLKINNNTEAIANVASVAHIGNVQSSSCYIGKYSTYPLTGYIPYILMYRRELADAEVTSLVNYLKSDLAKRGVVLAV